MCVFCCWIGFFCYEERLSTFLWISYVRFKWGTSSGGIWDSLAIFLADFWRLLLTIGSEETENAPQNWFFPSLLSVAKQYSTFQSKRSRNPRNKRFKVDSHIFSSSHFSHYKVIWWGKRSNKWYWKLCLFSSAVTWR